MIAFIDGKIEEINPTDVVINVGGIGYHIYISVRHFEVIKEEKNVKIFTHLQVREDAHTLYGFHSVGERTIFRLLVSVSGVGASTAMLVLSTLSLLDIKKAIVNGDAKLIQTVKGIGEKTAKRITIDLKDKIKMDEHDVHMTGASLSVPLEIQEKATAALAALGYNKTAAHKAVSKVCQNTNEILDVESIVKLVLKKS